MQKNGCPKEFATKVIAAHQTLADFSGTHMDEKDAISTIANALQQPVHTMYHSITLPMNMNQSDDSLSHLLITSKAFMMLLKQQRKRIRCWVILIRANPVTKEAVATVALEAEEAEVDVEAVAIVATMQKLELLWVADVRNRRRKITTPKKTKGLMTEVAGHVDLWTISGLTVRKVLVSTKRQSFPEETPETRPTQGSAHLKRQQTKL